MRAILLVVVGGLLGCKGKNANQTSGSGSGSSPEVVAAAPADAPPAIDAMAAPDAPAAPNGPTLSALRDATGGKAHIFEGSGGIFLIDSFRRGITGTMPGLDLLDGVVAVWKALARGDEEAAYRVYYPVCAIVALQLQAGLAGFLAVEKYLMVKRGLFASARRRKPYGWEMDAETAAEVDRLYDRMQKVLTERGA
jgi:4-hydroxy-tetrahydrodipicolinate synthase